ncbi:MAG: FeoB-associated Cys-rich membrane protein [Blautia sp.]
MGTWIVGIAVAGAVWLALYVMRRDKKRGKSCCGGNCGSCGMCHGKMK